MTSTHRLLPCPFDPAKSFFNVGIGTETLEIKPEWRAILTAPSAGVSRKEAA